MATGQFSKVLVTATGKEMIAQSQSGKTLTFTRVALGDGLVVDGEDISAFTAVKNECLSLPIAEYTALDNGQFRVQFRVNNQSVTTGFWHREIGIMAKIDNGTEKLYAYTTAGNQGNFIYDKTTPLDERVINVDFVVGNAQNLEVVINSSIVYATVKDLKKHDSDDTAHKSAIDKHDNDADAHATLKGATANTAGKRGMAPAPAAGEQDMALCGGATYKVLPIKGGGTGATTAAAACTSLGIFDSNGHLTLPDGSKFWIA